VLRASKDATLQLANDNQGADIRQMLHSARLRATRQRITLARLLLATKTRHVTAEILYEDALEARCPVSRATVCNVLRQFEQVRLLKRINFRRSKKAWFGVRLRMMK